MKYLMALTLVVSFGVNHAFCDDTNIVATFNTNSPRPEIDIQFTNFIPETFTIDSTPYSISDTRFYAVVQVKGSNTINIPVTGVSPLGAQPLTNNVFYCQKVALYGNFNLAESNRIAVNIPGQPPIDIPVNGELTNVTFGAFFKNFSLEIMPFDANGGGGLGLQYNLTYSQDLSSTNGINGFLVHASSAGQFGLSSGSSTSNSIQDTLNAEVDLEYMIGWPTKDWVNQTNTNGVSYPEGILLSPAGFEFNKELTFGNYAPKLALGGAVPYLDYPARLWRKLLGFSQNGSTGPTFVTGVSYIVPTTGTEPDPEAARVRDRWDSELIYDMPLWNQLSFRFTWNSYIGLDHPLWKYYYQVGAVYYVSGSATTTNANGLFFGYASGAEPPNFSHTASWQLGYTVKF